MIEKLLTPEVVVPLVAGCIGVSAFFSSGRAALTHAARPRMIDLGQGHLVRADASADIRDLVA